MDLKLDNLTRTAQRMLEQKNRQWSVHVTFNDRSTAWWIFDMGDAPTVPDVISLIESELMETGEKGRVRSMTITNVKRGEKA